MGPNDEGQVVHVKDLRMCAVAEGGAGGGGHLRSGRSLGVV